MRIDRVSLEQLPATHDEAFADYVVDMSYMTQERIRVRAIKNNVDFDLSVGAYEGSRMVGFTLLGVDLWQGALAAFDAGTGIVPAYRGKGLARAMLDHAVPGLRQRGVEIFLLEVIQSNEAAVRAYRKAGFQIRRELRCYELAGEPAAPDLDAGFSIRPVDRQTVVSLAPHADWHPSWETSFAAIERIPDELILFGAFRGDSCLGVVAFSPHFNWVMSLVVDRSWRRRGIGTALARHLMMHLPAGVSSVKILNVDASDEGMRVFLEQLGASRWIDQFEMVRDLSLPR